MSFLIRRAQPGELEALREVERRAGSLFSTIGMEMVAVDEPPSLEVIEAARAQGRLWLAEADTAVAGYCMAGTVDEHAHLEQVSVDPAYGRGGIGRALCARVEDWAVEEGKTAVTLTTFRDVVWNAPYYLTLGYRPMRDEEIGPELRAIRTKESEHGLDQWPRVCMIKPVGR